MPLTVTLTYEGVLSLTSLLSLVLLHVCDPRQRHVRVFWSLFLARWRCSVEVVTGRGGNGHAQFA